MTKNQMELFFGNTVYSVVNWWWLILCCCVCASTMAGFSYRGQSRDGFKWRWYCSPV